MSRVGVCSWSLQPKSPRELGQRVVATGLGAVQLALDPLRAGGWRWSERRTSAALRRAGIEACSGMMSMRGEDYSTIESIRRTGGLRSDEHWEANLAAAGANAAIARRLGLRLVSFHAGFLPEDPADPLRRVMLERLAAIADRFAAEGVDVALETGQESVDTLCSVLAELDRATIGVNFDPANMLLYGTGEPVSALAALAPFVRQVHVKDARASHEPGAWGEEVPVGSGEVDWEAFFAVIAREGLDVDLMIEREAGSDRVGDVRTAHALVNARRGAEAP